MVQIFLRHAPERIVTKKEYGTGYTALHIAILLNEPRLAELFLTIHPSSADILDKDGFSPFYLAVCLNQTEMFKLFLRCCPDCCKTLTDKGQNALHIAVERNIEGIISVIITDKWLSELMINQQDKNSNTPLHLAVYKYDKKMQDTLLGCQAQVLPIKNKEGLTFQEVSMRKVVERFFQAAIAGDTEVLEQLTVEHPAAVIFSKRNDQGEPASHVTLKNGRQEFAMKIFSYYPPALWAYNGKGDSVLHMAAKLGHREFFLEGARLLSQHFQGFSFAVEHDERRRDAERFRDSAVNGEGKSLLYVAAEKEYLEAAKLLLKNQAYCFDMDRAFMGPNGSTALHIATRNRNYDMVQIFLQHGVPESIIRRQEVETGYTPLHIAVFLNEPRLAKLFLTTRPSNANILDRDGFSPLHLAVQMNQTEIFELFLRHCPDCCMTLAKKGQNALHIAVERNNEGVISVIVKDRRLSELMVNQQDENGNTPLHLAAYTGDEKMQDTLLGCQAKVLPLRNKDGQTFQDVDKSYKEQKQKEKKEKLIEAMERSQSSLLVMATLIITVTFTAAFTLPGGYNGNQPNQGIATLVDRAGFAVFLVTDTMSMGSSIVATVALILFSSVFSNKKRFNILNVAIGAIAVSIIFMLVAFTAAVWLVIGSQRRWLAIFIAVITSCITLSLILLVAHIMLGSGIEDVSELLTKKNESEQKLDSDVK